MLSPFSELITDALDSAVREGASDEQIKLLEQAQADDEMSLESARIAAHNTVDCFNEVGGEAEYVEETTETGLPLPGYLAGFHEDLGEPRIDALIEGCEIQESFWVNKIYQLQPSSRELRDSM